MKPADAAFLLVCAESAGRKAVTNVFCIVIDDSSASLDSNPSEVPISTLETLRDDTKTVGVISHGELLRKRVVMQIAVEKQAGGTALSRLVS